MKKLYLLPLLMALGLALGCPAGGPPSGTNAAVRGEPGAFAPGPEDAAAADGGKGGFLGSNPSPEEFRPCLDPSVPCLLEKKEDSGEDPPAPSIAKMGQVTPPSVSNCDAKLVRLLLWKDDVRTALNLEGKIPEEAFKVLQSGDLDAAVVEKGYFQDFCIPEISREGLEKVSYPPSGFVVLFEPAGGGLTTMWAKPLTSVDHFKTLLSGGRFVSLAFLQPTPEDSAETPPPSPGVIKIPGKK